ncbi:MAG TPA: class I SAM-dependent methyltransferase [Candidatus Elarobacter sp.]|jgi:SAM-dependent methyltransferase|nr:class I SAM-dependent methyltransferase [Candidatus Elarobacter sp.]
MQQAALRIPSGYGTSFEVPLVEPLSSRDALIADYWAAHPRYCFFKSVKRDAALLDIGAGSGGLAVWKEWGSPVRDDLRMYAIDLFEGEYFDRYADFELIDPAAKRTKFDDATFDAAVLSHVIEHVGDQRALLGELRRVLKPGAKAYIEWPHPASTRFPRASMLAGLGLKTSTINFFDDGTHLSALQPEETKARLIDSGFDIVASGMIANDFLAPQLISYGYKYFDEETTTYGVWLLLGFSTYIIAQRRDL